MGSWTGFCWVCVSTTVTTTPASTANSTTSSTCSATSTTTLGLWIPNTSSPISLLVATGLLFTGVLVSFCDAGTRIEEEGFSVRDIPRMVREGSLHNSAVGIYSPKYVLLLGFTPKLFAPTVVGFVRMFPQRSKYLINHILSKILTYITTILEPSA